MKKYIIPLFLLLLSYIASSQEFEWAYSAGDWTDDMALGTTVDESGNTYITGFLTAGTTIGDTTFDNRGAYIAKFSPIGEVLWAKSFGNFKTKGIDIAIDNQGNINLTGNYSTGFSTEGFTVQGALQPRIFVMKMESNGNIIWLKDYGTVFDTGTTYVNSIDTDIENNIYIGGSFNYFIELGDSTYTVRGNQTFDKDMLLIKLSPDGDVLSVKNPGSINDEYIYDIFVCDYGIYIVGFMDGYTIEIDTNYYTAEDYGMGYIIKFTPDGDYCWANSFKNALRSETFSLTVDENGEPIVTGWLTTGNNTEDMKVFISKLDINGNILFEKIIDHHEYI